MNKSMLKVDHIQFIQNSSCLVTGGAGFIGANLVEKLVSCGAKRIVVLDDLSTGDLGNIEGYFNADRVEFVNASITELDAIRSTFDRIDIVFQLAALGSVPRSIDNPVKTNNVNVDGFLNVLVAAKDAGVKKVVYSSSSSIYGDDNTIPKVEEKIGNPLSPYAVSKRSNELYAKVFRDVYGMDIIGLRYFNVFGPKQNINGPYAAVIPIFITNLLKGETCNINGDGTISRDFTFVQNVVEANILAAWAKIELENPVFNVAMGDQISLNELYNKIEDNIGSGLKPIHKEKRIGDILSSLADISKAKKYLGYEPGFDFLEGIKQTIEWYRKLY
ncbi:MAG: NAD-dependent epimerase/dehydratase family protein [Crocinitomicaceae bacterium]